MLIEKNKLEPTLFKWRTSKGNLLAVNEMKTSHLFYTLRMIWNNTMPNPVPDNPRFYSFGSYYTGNYMKSALLNISRELFLRDDLTGKMKSQIQWMKSQMSEHSYALDMERLLS